LESARREHPERPVLLGAGASLSSSRRRHCTPVKLSRAGCSRQFGRAIEHHRAGEPPHGCGQAAVAQNAVEFEALPELVADRAGLAMALGRP